MAIDTRSSRRVPERSSSPCGEEEHHCKTTSHEISHRASNKRKSKETDFSSAEYWSTRFETERSFEWLASTSAICPIILEAVRKVRRIREGEDEFSSDTGGHANSSSTMPGHQQPLRLLHFGCGTSSLGGDVQRYLEQEAESVEVTDADYVADALAQADNAEVGRMSQEGGQGDVGSDDLSESMESFEESRQPSTPRRAVPLIDLDVLSLKQLMQHRPHRHIDPLETPTSDDADGWDLLLDKSTADAISCGPDMPLPIFPSSSATVDGIASSDSSDNACGPLVEPIIALCQTLAHATRKGGRWICISYSSTRFDHLSQRSTSVEEDDLEEPGWKLLSKSPVDGFTDSSPSTPLSAEGERVVYTPQVNVWAYVLERI